MLGRMDYAKRILEEVYYKYRGASDDEISSIFYNFLVCPEKDNYGITDYVSTIHDIDEEHVGYLKNEMMLYIVSSAYDFLKCYEDSESISEIEKEYIKRIEGQNFSYAGYVDMFKDPEIKEMICALINYCLLYRTQSYKYSKEVEETLFEMDAKLSEKFQRLFTYINTVDKVVSLFCEMNIEYEESLPPDDFEDDDDEELELTEEDLEAYEEYMSDVMDGEYDEELDDDLDELQEKFLEFKELVMEKTTQLFDIEIPDGFMQEDCIAYLMSLVYGYLQDDYEANTLAIEWQEMYEFMSKSGMTKQVIVQNFLANIEFRFNALDVLAEAYSNMFGIREVFEDDRRVTKLFKMLDSDYEPKECPIEIRYIGSPLVEMFDEMLCYLETENENGVLAVYNLLLSESTLDAIFYEFDIEDENIESMKVLMMRYLIRKYVEERSIRKTGELSYQDMDIYYKIMHSKCSVPEIVTLFFNYGQLFIENYFEMASHTIQEERDGIRSLLGKEVISKFPILDPTCIGDSIYFKAMNESDFYRLVEKEGIDATIRKLKEVSEDDLIDIASEVFVSIYENATEENKKDPLIKMVCDIFDSSGNILDTMRALLQDDHLVKQLIELYFVFESENDYPLSLESRVEALPKVKAKISKPEK